MGSNEDKSVSKTGQLYGCANVASEGIHQRCLTDILSCVFKIGNRGSCDTYCHTNSHHSAV